MDACIYIVDTCDNDRVYTPDVAMKATVKKWGNSAAVRIPASVMAALHLDLDEVVEVGEEKGRIVIEPVRQKAYILDDLLKGITAKNVHEAIESGPSRGKEAWRWQSSTCPNAGEIVWLNFTPQAGRRPALVLSPAAYNGKTGLMLCCSLTTQIKNYPFEVFIGGGPPNAVLADQVKSLDWRSRDVKSKSHMSPEQLAEVRAKIHALIG